MKFDIIQKPEELYVFIQISKGSKSFYIYDQGTLVMSNTISTPFPGNYGFAPKTHHDDAAPLDVVILSQEPLEPGSLVKTKPVGVIRLQGKLIDDVIIAVVGGGIKDVSELPMKQINEISRYLESFKNLKLLKVLDAEHAKKMIELSIKRYQKENE
ncbi:MAG: inorganic diphosphatase [Candidatus Aenigmarchaeota archaeon]|nr:inorganic diphosphatase [Candidatus Aenigmarchaeota archaeon]